MALTIGQLIKQSRLNRGLTQEELGELVGVKKSAVAKWENGRVSEIGRSNLQGLAKALGIDPAELIGEDGIEVRKRIKKRPESSRCQSGGTAFESGFYRLIHFV